MSRDIVNIPARRFGKTALYSYPMLPDLGTKRRRTIARLWNATDPRKRKRARRLMRIESKERRHQFIVAAQSMAEAIQRFGVQARSLERSMEEFRAVMNRRIAKTYQVPRYLLEGQPK
jgi:hypothetical protein